MTNKEKYVGKLVNIWAPMMFGGRYLDRIKVTRVIADDHLYGVSTMSGTDVAYSLSDCIKVERVIATHSRDF